MVTAEGYRKFVREQKALAEKQVSEKYKKYIKGKAKKIKRGLPKSKIISIMENIERARRERRKQWIKKMKQGRAMIRQQQMEAAEMIAAEQRSRYEQSDSWLDSRDEIHEMRTAQSITAPGVVDEYGRETSPASRAGSIAVSGLKRLGMGTQNLLNSFKNFNHQRMLKQQATGGTPYSTGLNTQEVNRWHNERVPNILTPQRNLLTPIGTIPTQTPFTSPYSTQLSTQPKSQQQNTSSAPRLNFWNA